MRIEGSTAIFAILVAFGLISVVVIETVFILPQEADALGCQPGGIGFNASKGRCFRG
jgi:hypothetical protein